MSFGENFLLMDVKPTSYTKKVEKGVNNSMTFYIENIKFAEDWRVYLVGTASNSNFDGVNQQRAFMKIVMKNTESRSSSGDFDFKDYESWVFGPEI